MNTSTVLKYALASSFMGESLLSGFNWQNSTDLSNGFVSYQSREDANAQGLYSIDNSTQVVRLGVDSSNVIDDLSGRPSIRIESKETFNHGLFIADFLHMPPSSCGLWPAFWMYGHDWPAGGELDIIEGANTAHHNVISAHTADGCFQDPNALYTGTMRNEDCAVGTQNIGCGFDMPEEDTASYGDGFNAAGGGVYAVEWEESGRIKVWHFSRSQVPQDIEARQPDPKKWGVPQAVFGGERCDVDNYFANMSIVINTNFCGDYGDATWSQSETCSGLAPTCSEYVANNPEAFANAYWDIRYIDAYQLAATTVTPPQVRPALPATSSAPAAANPTSLKSSALLGCFSQTAASTFILGGSDASQTLENCVETCKNFALPYAGVRGTDCFCAQELDAMTLPVDALLCDELCPGDDEEYCGGGSEDAPEGLLLTVYGDVEDEERPMQPPAKADAAAITAAEVFAKAAASTLTTTICPTATPNAEQDFIDEGYRIVLPPVETPVETPAAEAEPTPFDAPPSSNASDKLPDVKTGVIASLMAMCFIMFI